MEPGSDRSNAECYQERWSVRSGVFDLSMVRF
jgi:hypothetical protein